MTDDQIGVTRGDDLISKSLRRERDIEAHNAARALQIVSHGLLTGQNLLVVNDPQSRRIAKNEVPTVLRAKLKQLRKNAKRVGAQWPPDCKECACQATHYGINNTWLCNNHIKDVDPKNMGIHVVKI